MTVGASRLSAGSHQAAIVIFESSRAGKVTVCGAGIRYGVVSTACFTPSTLVEATNAVGSWMSAKPSVAGHPAVTGPICSYT